MFFDDNINYDDAKIVDARKIDSPDKPVWINQLLRHHLVKAEPLLTIRDDQFFIDKISQLERQFDSAIRARARMKSVVWRAIKSGGLRCHELLAATMQKTVYDAWLGHRIDHMKFSAATEFYDYEKDE